MLPEGVGSNVTEGAAEDENRNPVLSGGAQGTDDPTYELVVGHLYGITVTDLTDADLSRGTAADRPKFYLENPPRRSTSARTRRSPPLRPG